jgi:hypothetical protein
LGFGGVDALGEQREPLSLLQANQFRQQPRAAQVD